MKALLISVVATSTLLVPAIATAQNGHMMNGGMWGAGWMGGYGGIASLVLLVVVVAGVVAWLVKQKGA